MGRGINYGREFRELYEAQTRYKTPGHKAARNPDPDEPYLAACPSVENGGCGAPVAHVCRDVSGNPVAPHVDRNRAAARREAMVGWHFWADGPNGETTPCKCPIGEDHD